MADKAGIEIFDHVWADFGQGKVVGHVVQLGKVQEDGTTKYGIAGPDGGVAQLAYREPGDRDGGGSGRTFWKGGGDA